MIFKIVVYILYIVYTVLQGFWRDSTAPQVDQLINWQKSVIFLFRKYRKSWFRGLMLGF